MSWLTCHLFQRPYLMSTRGCHVPKYAACLNPFPFQPVKRVDVIWDVYRQDSQKATNRENHRLRDIFYSQALKFTRLLTWRFWYCTWLLCLSSWNWMKIQNTTRLPCTKICCMGRMSCHFLLSGSKMCSSLPFTIPVSESMISTVCVTLNCMRRNTRQFRWIKILSAILHFVISTVYVTSNCIRRNTRQFRWTKKLSAILILWLVLFMLHRTVWGATPASSDG